MKRTRWEGNEIILTEDMENNASSLVENIDDSFDVIGATAIMRGLQVTQAVTPNMTVLVPSGVAYALTEKNLLVNLASITATIPAADPTQDRRDIIEIKRLEDETTLASRQFKNPTTGAITTSPVNTETNYTIEVKVLSGSPGGSAPAVEAGYIKIAEVLVTAGTSSILNANIFNANAVATGLSNTGWTADIQSIYRNGSISEMKTQLYGLTQSITTTTLTVTGLTTTATLTSTGQTTLARDGGSVLIGTVLDSGPRLVVSDGGATPALGVDTVASIRRSGVAGSICQFSIISGNAGISKLLFGDTDAEGPGQIRYNHSNTLMDFITNGTVAATITSDQNTLIGTTVNSGPRLVVADGVGAVPTVSAELAMLVQNNSSTSNYTSIGILAGETGASILDFGKTSSMNRGRIQYNHFDSTMEFRVNNAQAMKISSNQHILIGTDSNPGETLHVNGSARFTGSGGNVVIRSEGNQIEFSQTGDNLLRATTSGGALFFVTSGRAGTQVNANLICNTDQSVTVNTTLLVDTISEKIVGNGIDLSGEFITYKSKRLTAANYIYSSSLTEDNIYDLLSPFLPDASDTMLITGAVDAPSIGLLICSHVTRSGSSVIIYGCDSTGAINSAIFQNGSPVPVSNISVSW